MGNAVTLYNRDGLEIQQSMQHVSRTRGTSKASIDTIRNGNGHLVLQGWGEIDGRPPGAIIAVVKGVIVAEAPVNQWRPDVARSSQKPVARMERVLDRTFVGFALGAASFSNEILSA